MLLLLLLWWLLWWLLAVLWRLLVVVLMVGVQVAWKSRRWWSTATPHPHVRSVHHVRRRLLEPGRRGSTRGAAATMVHHCWRSSHPRWRRPAVPNWATWKPWRWKKQRPPASASTSTTASSLLLARRRASWKARRRGRQHSPSPASYRRGCKPWRRYPCSHGRCHASSKFSWEGRRSHRGLDHHCCRR